jgi:hypothetical protein
MQEPLVVDYLQGRYVRQFTGEQLRNAFGLRCFALPADCTLWCGTFWAGTFGVLPGTACGSQPLEAFHSGWQREVARERVPATVEELLARMQER